MGRPLFVEFGKIVIPVSRANNNKNRLWDQLSHALEIYIDLLDPRFQRSSTVNIVLLFLCLARILKRAVLCQIDLNDPLLRPLVDDSRWLPLLESIGKSPTQLEAIEFEVTLPR
jgi:hypothetical protein